MNSKKFLIGTLVGGITFFILGYLFFGLALSSFFSKHTFAGSMKPMAEIVWWALILGNLAWGALLTYIFLKSGKITSFSSGAGTGSAIGFFMWLSLDMTSFATSNGLDLTGVLADIVVGIVMSAIAGGLIAATLGMGNKKAAA